jgi:cyclophilin family peptidyl-prolyl cis-trans isomerase
MTSRLASLSLAACLLTLPLTATAQEAADKKQPAAEKPQEEATPPQASFPELRDQWQMLNQRAKDLLAEARTAGADRRQAIRAEFREVFAEHEKVVGQLQEAALAEYRAAPEESGEAEQFLADLAADYLRRDRYEAALELLEPLVESDSDVPGVYETAGMAAFSLNDFDAAEEYLEQAKEQGTLGQEAGQLVSAIPEQKEKWQREQELREKEAAAEDLPRVRLATSKGEIVVELFENEAPNTVANFISLVEQGFYDGLAFHRVLGGFMAQGGDPAGDGTGGPGYTIKDEHDEKDARMHFRGSLSMAKTAAPNTGGSQFFLTFRPTPHLDGRHTVFGRVIEGMDVLPKLTRRQPSPNAPPPDKILDAEVLRKRDHEYQPKTIAE